MNTGMIPSRYAEALYEYAGEKSATERVYGGSPAIAGLVSRSKPPCALNV